MGLQPRHELREVPGLDRGADDDGEFEARQQRDRNEILLGIEARLGLHHRQQIHGGARGHENGGAVGLGALDRLDPDQPVATGAILDDHRAIEQLTHALAEHPA